MLNLAWGGYQNGAIPDTAMSPIDSRGHRLEHVAATQFLALQAAMLHDLGRTIAVAPGADSSFRTVAQQQADYQLYLRGGNVAAVPGTSNHGWGRAVDITGYEVHGDVWAWLLAHAGEYGYSHVTGAASGERWHWECTTPPGTTIAGGNATLIQEKDLNMGAYIISSPIGVTLVIDGVVAAGANTSDEYAGVKGATALTISGAQHKDYLAKLTQKQGLPLLCRVNGEAGVYILTDKLRPIQVQATLASLQSAGAPTVTISPAERDAWQ
ncbi:MAG: peptidase and DD-carboxypeptidase VanY/endolysin [Schumannella sp.]|nr:peptidase and DD-carboxypeptidase VanY/endolysin [Schumannella sp.]